MQMKQKLMKLTVLVALPLLIIACGRTGEQLESLSGRTMGTTYSVKYVQDNAESSISGAELQSKLDQRLVEINQLMSTYIPDSELSLLNKAPANQAFPISAETRDVILEALRISKLSDGALDITVGPLVNLWGFGPDNKPDNIPSSEQIQSVKAVIGADKFVLEANRVIKEDAGVYIDLSTIAKGYGVDELATILEDYGINNYLVEIGGEMRVSGTKQNNKDWLVAIEKPISTERAVQRIIAIGDNAIASSGDYRIYFEENGVRYSHLIDPTTFYPIQHNLVSVSVVASSTMEADGLATALIVMGADKGRQLAEREGIAALFITKEGTEFVEYRSTAFERQVNVVQ